jgi:hypothetical protein
MKINQRLPLVISEYIRSRFSEECLFEVKKIREKENRLYYTVEISTDDYVHTMVFNAAGKVVNEELNENFPLEME